MELLRTERLIIRKFRDSDFDDFYEYAADAQMSRMMGRDLITDRASAMPTFLWLKNHEPRGYVLELKETGKVIGNLTVCEPPDSVKTMAQTKDKRGKTLSFSVSGAYQRRGIMLEALQAVIGHLFDKENIDYINCGYLDFNVPSRELQKKLGFAVLTTQSFRQDGETFTVIEQILWKDAR